MSKVCTVCKEVKPFEEFTKSSRGKDGYHPQCKDCKKKKENEWAQENREKKLDSRKRYREKNREQIRKTDREAYQKDPEKFRAKARISQKKYFNSEKGRKKYRDQSLILRKRFPEKARARSLLSNAVCDGKIIRPSKCSLCGDDKSVIEAHHSDYSKPLDVVWVCKTCHFMIHRERFHRERLNPKTS